MIIETSAQRSARMRETLNELRRTQLRELDPDEHPNPAVRVWKMVPGVNYGASLKSAKSMKVLGYEVGEPRRWMPVTVAKRLVKAGHCTWGLLDGHSDAREAGYWISAVKTKEVGTP